MYNKNALSRLEEYNVGRIIRNMANVVRSESPEIVILDAEDCELLLDFIRIHTGWEISWGSHA